MSVTSLFDGYNAGYAQALYERFAEDPESVPPQWRAIFSQAPDRLTAAGLRVPDALPGEGTATAPEADRATDAASIAAAARPLAERAAAYESRLLPRIARAVSLIQAFRDHGHQLAKTDPLGSDPPGHPQLDPGFFGTSNEDLEEIPTSLVLPEGGDRPLNETLRRLREIYCGSIGYQFEHLEDPEKVRWLWSRVESGDFGAPLTGEARIRLLGRLTEVEGMERFLHRSYLGQKRFSIEGTDMLVPMLDLAVEEAASGGARRVILGMAHRGRLNVLVHILGIGYRALLREFEEAPQAQAPPARQASGTGDVKYHLGAEGSYELPGSGSIDVALAPNPSHLEFVNPVAVGMSRALQYSGPRQSDPADTSLVVPVLIHGDAAFAAQGVVAESLNLARLEGYSVGGAVHIIVNNQVGFTTEPREGRSTRYASDLAKGYDVPILRVNADDPEACLRAIRLAMAYRASFRDDVLIDLAGYRRYGHNEGDEPSYTQPLLSRRISAHPTVRALWAARLIQEGDLTEGESRRLEEEVQRELRSIQQSVQAEVGGRDGERGEEASRGEGEEADQGPWRTAVDVGRLTEVNRGALQVPEGFSVHEKLRKQLEHRRSDFGPQTTLDWSHAESLALGSILQEGIAVRITGQDTKRGTFSQRHAVLHDVETGREITPLAGVGTGRFEVYNSPLSEVAVLGFEYGHSVVSDDLVIWEAQFGDFVNVAQVIVDQFIASGRTKWGQESRLTLLLPHGYEGQGPEHSSARLERFLHLCAEGNMRVAYPTTPAQYFHLLRSQSLVPTARPLVVMTPKSLLRRPRASSRVSELEQGHFRPVLPDSRLPGSADEITRLVLCTGKVYYDLAEADARRELPHVALGRIEQLYGFPEAPLMELMAGYPKLEEVVWAQEEPGNMGALTYTAPRLREMIPGGIRFTLVARPEWASPAEGRPKTHRASQERVVRTALGLG